MNLRPLAFGVVALTGSLVISWAIYSYFFPMPDAWSKVSRGYELSKIPLIKFNEKVYLVDYQLKRGSHTRVVAAANTEGLYLKTSWPRNLFSGPLHISWSSIDACGQTIWCPDRDTNFWMDKIKVSITVKDNENTYFKMCRDNGVAILSPAQFQEVKYGNKMLDQIKATSAIKDLAKKCS